MTRLSVRQLSLLLAGTGLVLVGGVAVAGSSTGSEPSLRCADGSPLNSVCPQDPVQYVDCTLDDYFAAAPPPGSYLATHWNVADSAYLQSDAAPPPAPRITVSAPASMPAGASVPVSAAVELPAGRTATVTWSVSRSGCRCPPQRGPRLG